MRIANQANVRVTYSAASNYPNKEESLKSSFNVGFQGGVVMGFCLVSLALSILSLIIVIYKAIINPTSLKDYELMFDYIAGYELGGSSVALFWRVGGGI